MLGLPNNFQGGFPTRNDHFGVFGGLPPLKETPIERSFWLWYIGIIKTQPHFDFFHWAFLR